MSDLRFFLLEPDVVFQAQIDQSVFEYPIDEVAYTNVTTGSFSAIKPGMTVFFGDTQGGNNLGRQRIRKVADASKIYIGRSSQGKDREGEVDLADGRWITVIDDRRVLPKIPYIDDDGVTQKDSEVPFQAENPPVSNVGAPMAGEIDGGTGKLRVTLPHESNTSFATEPGASISTYAWDLPSGVTLVSGTINDAQITVDCDPGYYNIACTVTDSNGRAHGATVPVLAIDPADDPTIPVQVESHTETLHGQQLSVRVLADIPASTYPDGTVALAWEGEPSGPTDRSHMVFYGWHQGEEESILGSREATLKDTVLQCLDVAGRLDVLPGFPQTVESNDSPDSWLQMADPNMDRYLVYLAYWHFTALEVADFKWSGTGDTFQFVIMGSDGESGFDQINKRAQAMTPDYHLTCNRLGQLQVVVNPMLQDAADRTATVQTTLTEADWREVRYAGQYWPRYHWHRRWAIVASGTEIRAVRCVAPGLTPGFGLSDSEQDQKLTPSQAVLNSCEGHRYARMNAKQGFFTILLADSDLRGIEPADLTWVQLDIPAAYAARRGLNFTNERGLVHEVNIRYEHGREGTTKTIELLWERETSGTPAVTEEISDDELPDPEYEPDDDWYDDDPGPTPGDGMGTVYVMTEDTLGRTRDFSAVSPSWESIGPAGSPLLWDFILDPWNPLTTGYLSSEDGLYKSTDLDEASPTWSLVLTPSDVNTATGHADFDRAFKVIASITTENMLWLSYSADSNRRLYLARTENGGSSWSHSEVVFSNGGDWTDAQGGVDVVQHIPTGSHVIYNVVGAAAAVNNSNWSVFKSTDNGDAWSEVFEASDAERLGAIHTHCPYHNNENGNVAYVGFDNAIYKTEDGGNSWTRVNSPEGTDIKRHGVEAFTQDSDIVIHWDRDGDLWRSEDGGNTWARRTGTGLDGTASGTGGFPSDDALYYVVTSNGIFVSTDGAETFTEKTGDWSFGFAFTATRRHGVIVPVWVPE